MVDTMLMFDMRSPSIGAAPRDLYAAAPEMAAYADKHGIDRISVCEHHGAEDGYMPCPMLFCAALATRTKRARIMPNAVILPLHDPVQIAEQIAVTDLLSGGRLDVLVGAGYVPSEFAMFGVSLADRGRLLDESLDVLIRALSGERFVANGRPVFVRPLPLQRPYPPLFLGGGVKATAVRAARLGAGLVPLKVELMAVYDEECRKLGREPGQKLIFGRAFCVHVTEDPDKGWAEILPHAAHVVSSYARWAAEGTNSSSPFESLVDEDAVRKSGLFHVLTPDQCIAYAGKCEERGYTLTIQPQIGGLPPEIGWKSLEVFCTKVLPRLRANAA
ncbi:MAG: LLM class flavin-dependent oxidoreductase [Chloroflexota bacterium]|nr:MAG: LLM class flavin-dependent oxidoreductase [Chloroflexota bacterium]